MTTRSKVLSRGGGRADGWRLIGTGVCVVVDIMCDGFEEIEVKNRTCKEDFVGKICDVVVVSS
jgi:hypothetical protein